MPVARNTKQRQLVMQAVQALRNHPTADEVYQHVTQHHPKVSRATVYRNLNLLAERGDIQRVSHLNAADRFDFKLEPHYHLRCVECNRVFDVALPYQDNLMQKVPNPEGFAFLGYEITFSGICPACQQTTASLA